MSIFPYRFSTNPSMQPKSKKEVKTMACSPKKKASKKVKSATSTKTIKSGCKK